MLGPRDTKRGLGSYTYVGACITNFEKNEWKVAFSVIVKQLSFKWDNSINFLVVMLRFNSRVGDTPENWQLWSSYNIHNVKFSTPIAKFKLYYICPSLLEHAHAVCIHIEVAQAYCTIEAEPLKLNYKIGTVKSQQSRDGSKIRV